MTATVTGSGAMYTVRIESDLPVFSEGMLPDLQILDLNEYATQLLSWLNIAEMELSVWSRQCLGTRRFATLVEMAGQIDAWAATRNTAKAGTHWQFTTADARIKLKALYPIPDTDR